MEMQISEVETALTLFIVGSWSGAWYCIYRTLHVL